MFTNISKNRNRDRQPAKKGEPELEARAERRVYERFHSDLDTRLFYGKLIYAGKITNLSQKGLFIRTKVEFPVKAKFMIAVLIEGRIVKIPVKVVRTSKKDVDDGHESGIGVELLDYPGFYLDYVGKRWFSREVLF